MQFIVYLHPGRSTDTLKRQATSKYGYTDNMEDFGTVIIYAFWEFGPLWTDCDMTRTESGGTHWDGICAGGKPRLALTAAAMATAASIGPGDVWPECRLDWRVRSRRHKASPERTYRSSHQPSRFQPRSERSSGFPLSVSRSDWRRPLPLPVRHCALPPRQWELLELVLHWYDCCQLRL